MYRYKLTVEYDGSKFYGFQKQKNLITVQQVLEKAISNLDQNPVSIFCAGRTDSGVHATGQVIHFDLSRNLPSAKVKLAVNYFLKNCSVSICKAENLGTNSVFHARFSAKARRYKYKILLQNYKPTFNSHLYWWLNQDINHKKMHEAAQLLVGTHDFTSFRSKSCNVKTPIKTVSKIDVSMSKSILTINITAPSFLHHQVRFIVGALVKVGLNKWDKQQLKKVLLSKDNTKNASLAPPNGLYLVDVFY